MMSLYLRSHRQVAVHHGQFTLRIEDPSLLSLLQTSPKKPRGTRPLSDEDVPPAWPGTCVEPMENNGWNRFSVQIWAHFWAKGVIGHTLEWGGTMYLRAELTHGINGSLVGQLRL